MTIVAVEILQLRKRRIDNVILGREGWRVAMIEQSALMYGGTCINIGCVPTKSLVFRSEHLDADGTHPDDYRRAVAETADLTADLRAVNFATLDNIGTVTVITGTARFTDPHTLPVTTEAGEISVAARWIVIGTGSRPALPDVPGLAASTRLRTSTDPLTEERLPARLVVLGGGYVGLEFAAMYAASGSEVTVLERHARVLAREDREIFDTARNILIEKGIRIATDVQATGVSDTAESSAITYLVDTISRTVVADVVLVALGREPATEDLDLAADVAIGDSGAVLVMNTYAPANPTSSPSATSTAVHSSPTSRSTSTESCSIISSAAETERRQTERQSPTHCS